MKSLTIHNIEHETAEAIEKMANASGLSQNKVVKKLLKKALELGTETSENPRRDLSAFAGAWTEEDASTFEKSLKDFEKVDEDMWL